MSSGCRGGRDKESHGDNIATNASGSPSPSPWSNVNLLVALPCRSCASALPERIFTRFKGCSSALAGDKVAGLLSKGWSWKRAGEDAPRPPSFPFFLTGSQGASSPLVVPTLPEGRGPELPFPVLRGHSLARCPVCLQMKHYPGSPS